MKIKTGFARSWFFQIGQNAASKANQAWHVLEGVSHIIGVPLVVIEIWLLLMKDGGIPAGGAPEFEQPIMMALNHILVVGSLLFYCPI